MYIVMILFSPKQFIFVMFCYVEHKIHTLSSVYRFLKKHPNIYVVLDFSILQLFISYTADPGEARGCFTNIVMVNSLTKYVTLFLPRAIWHRKAQTVKEGASSHKIDHFSQVQDLLNLEGHQNCIYASKVMAGLLKRVDFAYWWSCFRKGLWQQPWPQACLSLNSNKKSLNILARQGFNIPLFHRIPSKGMELDIPLNWLHILIRPSNKGNFKHCK